MNSNFYLMHLKNNNKWKTGAYKKIEKKMVQKTKSVDKDDERQQNASKEA